MDEMPGVGGWFARVGGFMLTKLHVISYSAWAAPWGELCPCPWFSQLPPQEKTDGDSVLSGNH